MGGAFRCNPRYLVALAAIVAAIGCSKEREPGGRDEPAPIPTTPEHRKPMSASEVKRYEAMAAQQIASHKDMLAAECYEPAKGKTPAAPAASAGGDGKLGPEALKKVATGSSTKLTVMIVFDEEGKEATREVMDSAESASGVAECVGKRLPPLEVPAAKRTVRIRVALTFP